MYRSAKRDKNEPRIRRYFERCGAKVVQLDDPGIPDLLLSYRGRTTLVEVKGEKGKLTSRQKTFIAGWKAPVYIVRNCHDAKLVLRSLTLPIYTYQCKTCEKRLEVVQSFFDTPLSVCPECAGQLIRIIVKAPVIIYKGNGWAGDHAGK